MGERTTLRERNRIGATEDGASVSATYDARDRLSSVGSTTYSHNVMGQLTSKTTGASTTTYDYDELDNLMQVVLPSKTIEYVVDGMGRRVARKIGGTTTNRYLYGQGILPIAELNADGSGTRIFGLRNRFGEKFYTDKFGYFLALDRKFHRLHLFGKGYWFTP